MDKFRKIERIRTASPLAPALLALVAAGCGGGARDEGGRPPDVAWRDIRNEVALKQHQAIVTYWGVAAEASDRVALAIGVVRSASRLDDASTVDGLRREVVEALLAAHAIEEALRGAARELRHAPRAYRDAAGGFRDRSEDYEDEGFRKSCLEWSGCYEALAEGCPAQLREVEQFSEEVRRLTPFLRETQRILDDYSLFLATFVEAVPPHEAIDGQVRRLRSYAENFTAFEVTARRFGDLTPSRDPSKAAKPRGRALRAAINLRSIGN